MDGTLRGLLLVTLLVAVAMPASAKDYTVGDSSGWKPGVDYTAWAKGKTFNIGDTLSFQYSAAHSVLEVSAADHGACSAANPLRSHRDQSTTVPLTKPGTRYFICGAAGHCASGMKLAITVSGGAPASTSGAAVRSMNTTPADAAEPDASGAAGTGRGAGTAAGLLVGAVGLLAMMG